MYSVRTLDHMSSSKQTSGGGSVSNDLLPWIVDISPFAMPSYTNNWQHVSIQNSLLPYAGYAQNNGGTMNAEIGWDIVLSAGVWTFEIIHWTRNNNGIYTVMIDGTSIGTIDGYNSGNVYNQRDTISGIIIYKTKLIRLSLKMSTKNANSGGYYSSFSLVRMRRVA